MKLDFAPRVIDGSRINFAHLKIYIKKMKCKSTEVDTPNTVVLAKKAFPAATLPLGNLPPKSETVAASRVHALVVHASDLRGNPSTR